MEDNSFKNFLNKKYTPLSVISRMTRAHKAEELLGYDLNEAVKDKKTMYESLIFLRKNDNREENYQNAVRCYYEFKNGIIFPRLKKYENEEF